MRWTLKTNCSSIAPYAQCVAWMMRNFYGENNKINEKATNLHVNFTEEPSGTITSLLVSSATKSGGMTTSKYPIWKYSWKTVNGKNWISNSLNPLNPYAIENYVFARCESLCVCEKKWVSMNVCVQRIKCAIHWTGKCKLVSLTVQRASTFIKCNAFRTNSNHNANDWIMATVYRIQTVWSATSMWAQPWPLLSISFARPSCAILFDSHLKNHMWHGETCERVMHEIQRYAASIPKDYFGTKIPTIE